MKGTKYTVTIVIEVLSLDSVPALLDRARTEIAHEVSQGNLIMDDGDSIDWSSQAEFVEF